jgi:hypothetical protein
MNGIILFIIGIIAGWALEKFFLDKAYHIFQDNQKRSHYKKINLLWNRYNELTPEYELILHGWLDSIFKFSDVIITVEGTFQLDDGIKKAINYEEKVIDWSNKNLQNNQLVGISKIDPFRLTENLEDNKHILHISAHRYNYFDFLSTGRIYFKGSLEEKERIKDFIKFEEYLPQEKFPNPLSIGLTLLCENEKYIVFGKRSPLPSSGGDWKPLTWFNPVGENANVSDFDGNYHRQFPKLSIWNTAKRGLYEELGIIDEISDEKVQIHSFVYDTQILDYKFFGFLNLDQSCQQIRQNWKEKSIDKEFVDLQFVEISTMKQVHSLIESFILERNMWATECVFCSIRSLLFMKKLSLTSLLNIINEK